jgi:phosphoketolase
MLWSDRANAAHAPPSWPGHADHHLTWQCKITLAAHLLRKIDAYWPAANDRSVGQMDVCDHLLLKRPLRLAHVNPLVTRHWGTTPSRNFIHVQLSQMRDAVIGHKRDLDEHGQDVPEILDWKCKAGA